MLPKVSLPFCVQIERQLKAVEGNEYQGDGLAVLAMSCLEGKMACGGLTTGSQWNMPLPLESHGSSHLEHIRPAGCWLWLVGLASVFGEGRGGSDFISAGRKDLRLAFPGGLEVSRCISVVLLQSVITRSDGTKSSVLKCAFYKIPKYSPWSLLSPSCIQLSVRTVKKKSF